MKIEFEIPKWAEKRVIHVLAGIEHLALQLPGERLKIKIEQCNWCGECCMNLNPKTHPFEIIDGKCMYLQPEPPDRWKCGLTYFRPYICCINQREIPNCSIEYKYA